MPELRQVFETVTRQIEPDLDSWEKQLKRHRRWARNRKMSALAVAAAIVAAISLFAATTLNRGKDGSAPATVVPSGSGLAFTVVGLDGSVRSSLPNLPEGAGHPDLSPDGTTVAFAISRGALHSQIATMRLDGREFRIITDDLIVATRPRWSPDGSQLLFYRADQKGILHFMVMNADGTDVREIPGKHTPDDVPPDWSPDGSLILYTTFAGKDLATVPVTGGPSHRLIASVLDEGAGTWSPDGRSIAFRRETDFTYEIWLMNADGSGQELLASLPDTHAEAPEWSPDGSTIAFIGSVNGIGGVENGSEAVYVVDVATGDITEVMRGIAIGGDHDSRATWLSDGDALLVMTKTQ